MNGSVTRVGVSVSPMNWGVLAVSQLLCNRITHLHDCREHVSLDEVCEQAGVVGTGRDGQHSFDCPLPQVHCHKVNASPPVCQKCY